MVGEDKRVFIIKWFKNQSFEKPMDWIITLYKIMRRSAEFVDITFEYIVE